MTAGWPMLVLCLYLAGFLWTLLSLVLAFRKRGDEAVVPMRSMMPDPVIAVVLAVVFVLMAVGWPIVLPLAKWKGRS